MKILLKIFRSNMWNFRLCFISAVLVSTILFVFEGIKELIFGTMSDAEKASSPLGISLQIYIYLLLFIGLILVLYTVKNYSRIRIRDYGIFMVLGSEKYTIIQLIVIEYGIISLLSYFVGCILGTLFLFLVKKIIIFEGIIVVLQPEMFLIIVLKTFQYVLAIFLVAVALNIISLQRNSLSSLLQYKEKRSKLPSVKVSMTGAVLGIVAIAISFILLCKQPVSYKQMKYGIISGLCGAYLCFTCFGGMALYLLKKKEKWYYAYLLRIKNLYYRFSESKNIILLVFVINFFVLVFINLNIIEYGNTTSQYIWKYPYDFVWLAEKKDIDEISNVTEKYRGETKACQYTILSSADGGSYMGFPVTAYNQFTGEKVDLKSGEAIAVMQKAQSDNETMFQANQVQLQDKGTVRPFKIKKEVKEILFVAQQPECIFILVLNDQDYSILENAQNSNKVVITQNLEESDETLEDQLDLMAKSSGAMLYSKNKLMLQDRKEDIITLVFYICMGIFLIISNMTILAIKVWTEIPVLSGKYDFLRKIGMDATDVKNNIKSELSIYLTIPFVLSSVIGLIPLIYLAGNAGKHLFVQSVIMFSVLFLLQLFYIVGMKNYGYQLVAREVRNKGKGIKWN